MVMDDDDAPQLDAAAAMSAAECAAAVREVDE